MRLWKSHYDAFFSQFEISFKGFWVIHPNSTGTVAALSRHSRGTVAALSRHCGGTLAALWRHCGGTLVALWRHSRGTLMRHSRGTLVALSWHSRGTVMALSCLPPALLAISRLRSGGFLSTSSSKMKTFRDYLQM